MLLVIEKDVSQNDPKSASGDAMEKGNKIAMRLCHTLLLYKVYFVQGKQKETNYEKECKQVVAIAGRLSYTGCYMLLIYCFLKMAFSKFSKY